jgi:hypothetical protein
MLNPEIAEGVIDLLLMSSDEKMILLRKLKRSTLNSIFKKYNMDLSEKHFTSLYLYKYTK